MFAFVTEPACLVLGLLYAPFLSFKAIQTDDGKDDKQWLTFWVVYALLIAGPISSFILSFIPFYSELKLALVIWMIFYNGAEVIYNKLVRPLFERYEKDVDQMISDLPGTARKAVSELGKAEVVQQALANGAKFIREYGPEAYRQIIAIAMKTAMQEVKTGNASGLENVSSA